MELYEQNDHGINYWLIYQYLRSPKSLYKNLKIQVIAYGVCIHKRPKTLRNNRQNNLIIIILNNLIFVKLTIDEFVLKLD